MNYAGIRIKREDRSPCIPGMDVVINGRKAGWLAHKDTLDIRVSPGLHLVQVGLVSTSTLEPMAGIVVSLPERSTAIIVGGAEKRPWLISASAYYYIEAKNFINKILETQACIELEDRTLYELILEERRNGTKNSTLEQYFEEAQSFRQRNRTNTTEDKQDQNTKDRHPDKAYHEIIGAYATLGLEPNASEDEIKQAYRQLVLIHHPDKGGNPKSFARIQSAYEIIASLRKD